MTRMDSIRLVGVSERDIDLLLVEEFMASPDFLSWFLSKIGMTSNGCLHRVHHSVNTSNGESDIELEIKSSNGLEKVLIENKIDAGFQPKQAKRYDDRATQYRSSGKYFSVITVLAAPDEYAKNSDLTIGFDKRISYESMLDWYKQAEQLGNRRIFKQSLLLSAIDRCVSGWTLVPDEKATRFWENYWRAAEKYAQELHMRKPNEKPATSSFIFFNPIGLEKGVKLVHKVPYGKVDLQFAGFGENLTELERRYGSKLEKGMHLVRAAKSGVIRINVAEMNLSEEFDESKAKEALKAALKLWKWYRKTLDVEVRI
jgi:hypothetical protein